LKPDKDIKQLFVNITLTANGETVGLGFSCKFIMFFRLSCMARDDMAFLAGKRLCQHALNQANKQVFTHNARRV